MKNLTELKACEYQMLSTDFNSLGCCTEDYHIQIYLEHALENNITIEKQVLHKFFINKQPKVRLLAIKIYLKLYSYDESLEFTQLDPFYRIRLHSIPNIEFSKLLKMIEDENDSVKVAVLTEIMNRNIPPQDKINVFNSIGKCIVHPNMNVRLITAKLLRIFKGLELSVVNQLLSKNDEEMKNKNICGLIIYGLEDEYYEIRESTINSLYFLTDSSSIHKTFSHFVDSLNDESLNVRRAAVYSIEKFSSSYKIVADFETTKQICFLLKEADGKITQSIIKIFNNLCFKEIDSVLEIIESIHKLLTRESILLILIAVFKNNVELIINNMDHFYKYSPFLEQQIVLTDTKYFCRLLMVSLCIFNKFKIKLDRNTKKHVKFVLQEISMHFNLEMFNLKDFTKDCLARFIESDGNQRPLALIFKKRHQAPDFFKFALCLVNFFKEYKANRCLIQKINYYFTNINLTNDIVMDNTALVCFIYDLDFDSIKRVNNVVNIRKCSIFKGDFIIELYFEISTSFENTLLVLEDDQGRQLTYQGERQLKVSFFNDSSMFFKYFLKVQDNENEFIISKVKTITREKKEV